MVGDSPEIDIAGGKKNGLKTVLVETGLYTEENKNEFKKYLNDADYIVPNIESAVDTILKEKGIL